MLQNACTLKYLLDCLIASSRGGGTRAKIIEALKEKAQNTNQLTVLLGLSYKTISYHLEILKRYRLVISVDNAHVGCYCLSRNLENNYDLFENLLMQMYKGRISCQQVW